MISGVYAVLHYHCMALLSLTAVQLDDCLKVPLLCIYLDL